jgi:hypothetical protein
MSGRDVASDPDVEAFHQPGNEDLAIGHRQVVAVVLVLVQKLVAPESVRGGVAIVFAVDRRDTKTPVDVILLDRIRQTLDIEHGLVELHIVGIITIRRRRVAAAHRVGGEVTAGIDPAVDLDMHIVEPVTERRNCPVLC